MDIEHTEDIFICPNCGAKFQRDAHYQYIVFCQNMINIMMGCQEIVDMCSCCNYFGYPVQNETEVND